MFQKTSSAPWPAFALSLAMGLATASSAQASVGDTYGYGARTGALAGATVMGGFGGYSAYLNPAGLSLQGPKRLTLSWSLISMTPSFKSIQGVVVENTYESDKTSTGDVDTDYLSTIGQALGVAYRLFPDFYDFSIGLTAYLPLNQIGYIDSGETFQPEYVLYRSRPQAPDINLAIGQRLSPMVRAGIGLHMAFDVTSKATVFINTEKQNSSDARLTSSIKNKFSLYYGLLITPPHREETDPLDSDFGPLGDWAVGLVVRLPSTSHAETVARADTKLPGSASVPSNFSGDSDLLYDPLSVELGGSYQYSPIARVLLEVDYQRWSAFKAPFNTLTAVDPAAGGLNPVPVKVPPLPSHDILIPRIAHEYEIGHFTLRAGYAFRKGVVSMPGTEAGNYLDPTKHIFGVGVGARFNHFLHYQVPWTLDVNLEWQQLVTQHIVKSPGDENGNATDSTPQHVPTGKIGSPGYEAGGKILGGGVSLTWAF